MTTRSKNPNDGRVWGWIKKLQKGDVIRSRSGALRVVRAVDHFGPGICRTVVHLAIKRCSWTHRAYTVYNGNDLRQMGYRMVIWPVSSLRVANKTNSPLPTPHFPLPIFSDIYD